MVSLPPPAARLTTRLAACPVYLVFSVAREGFARQLPAARTAAAELLAGAGAGALQLRVKDADSATRRTLLLRLRDALPAGVLLLVNDDLSAVRSTDGVALADGLHLGREDAAALAPPGTPVTEATTAGLRRARESLGPELLLGASTRTLDEVAQAFAAGCDHVGFGALAPSTTRPGATPADPRELRRAQAAFPSLPIFPIGGLGPGTLALATAAGVRRAAIGAAILQAPDPAAAVRACLAALRA
jgi:thiamine-phosphate pyrophosphorylase